MDSKCLAEHIKSSRLDRKESQFFVANKLGIDYKHYRKIEDGLVDIKLSTLTRLIDYFQLNFNQMRETSIEGEEVFSSYPLTQKYKIDLKNFNFSNEYKKLQKLGQDYSIAVAYVSVSGHFLYVNDSHLEMFKVSHDEVMGKTLGELPIEKTRTEYYEKFNRLNHEYKAKPQTFFDEVILKDGTTLKFKANWDYVQFNGENVGTLSFITKLN